ncbi:Uncharacterized protein Adt_38550 [Abeliophyllum distichum]|uniref:Uncharacterized protein n=1 Tax=Abeliophyllum distichum TaxID=126358 RepID=A0ABD1Q3G3_9LAMI
MSASRPEMLLTREPSISSSRKFLDQSKDSKNFPVQTSRIGSLAGASGYGISTPGYANTPSSTGQLAFSSKTPLAFYLQANFPLSGIVPISGGSQGFFSCEWFNMIVHRPSIRICTGSGGSCSMFIC